MKKGNGRAFRKSANPGLAALKRALNSSNAAGIHADQQRNPKDSRRKNRKEERDAGNFYGLPDRQPSLGT